MKYNTFPTLKAASLYEIKTFHYTVAAEWMAEIEVLVFSDTQFAAQARFRGDAKDLKAVATKTTFESFEEAFQDIVKRVEAELQKTGWVQEIEKMD